MSLTCCGCCSKGPLVEPVKVLAFWQVVHEEVSAIQPKPRGNVERISTASGDPSDAPRIARLTVRYGAGSYEADRSTHPPWSPMNSLPDPYANAYPTAHHTKAPTIASIKFCGGAQWASMLVSASL